MVTKLLVSSGGGGGRLVSRSIGLLSFLCLMSCVMSCVLCLVLFHIVFSTCWHGLTVQTLDDH